MTKVTTLGQLQGNAPENKKIEFVKVLLSDGELSDIPMAPNKFTDIILLTRGDVYDVFYAYKDEYHNGCVYLGHFNDGIV